MVLALLLKAAASTKSLHFMVLTQQSAPVAPQAGEQASLHEIFGILQNYEIGDVT